MALVVDRSMKNLLLPVLAGLLIAATYFLARAQDPPPRLSGEARETHLQNVRQRTFGGQNAEAYFASDGIFIAGWFGRSDFLSTASLGQSESVNRKSDTSPVPTSF